MGILSIQSHVVYGYVGNKAAVYPLQSMGYDVWPVNTVQFSTHTGYPNWKGEVFSREHINQVIMAIESLALAKECEAILSGYMGSKDTCLEVYETVARFKKQNPELLYLCDPVIGNTNCFVKPEVLDFFKTSISADIITPNQFEAQTLSGIKITDKNSLMKAAKHFHERGIKTVVITGVKNLPDVPYDYFIYYSEGEINGMAPTKEYDFPYPVNGTGDLFSAVFLGTYLKTKDVVKATINAAYYMEKIVGVTHSLNARELQILSTKYSVSGFEE